jgi:2-octaprenyl-6-methoxyphenol hydroxylase
MSVEQGASESDCDVLIAGGSFAGLALGLALRRALGERFAVVVADPALARGSVDPRATAFAASARRLLAALDIWPQIAAGAQPILDMVITDSKLENAVRPTFLTFSGELEPGEPFAHMVENGPLLVALTEAARAAGVVLLATGVESFERAPHRVAARLANGALSRTRLLIAADGARSRLREQAAIQNFGWTYPQSAIVTTVAHERDHGGTATEHFLPPGPFATLPLTAKRSSIVWTERSDEARRIAALPDGDFLQELERRFGLQWGDLSLAGPRAVFPLGYAVARSFIAERLALIGDAAHVIHPIAGQGLNLGLRDVAALAEAIVDAARLGLDIGADPVLERYQRWRRFDTMTNGATMDGLNRLFSNDSELLRLVRDFGLGVVDRLPALKAFFMREAAGLTGDVPKLMRGEAL